MVSKSWPGPGWERIGELVQMQRGGPPFHDEGPAYYRAAFRFFRPYAKPGPYRTKLSIADEARFRRWVRNNRVPFDVRAKIADYDMRGFWKRTGGRGWRRGMHFPDTFKTPYDTTFSRQSKYAAANNPFDWVGDNLVDLRNGRIIFSPREGA
jgi:hypothetical protein